MRWTIGNGGRALQASNDYFGSGTVGWPRNGTIHRSTDNGHTWQYASTAVGQYWSTLFVRGSEVYTLGVSGDNSGGVNAGVVIQQSLDDGMSWAKRTVILSASHGYSTGPTPALFHNGRIWRAVEYNAGSWGSGYHAVVVSAPQDSDLMNASSMPHRVVSRRASGCLLRPCMTLGCCGCVQTGSRQEGSRSRRPRHLYVTYEWCARTSHPTTSVRARVQIPANWSVPGVVSNYGWLEGNAVAGPGGVVYDVLRVNSVPTANKAALVRVNSPTSPPVFDRCDLRTCLLVSYALHTCAPREPWCGFHGRFIDFPGGMTKFTIRYDPTTKLWVTLANTVTDASIWPNHGCTFTKAGGAVGVSSSAPQPCCGATALVTCHDCLWCRAQSRNLLTLNTSPDLVNWSVRATIMSDDTGFQPWSSMLYTGFQYVLRLAPTRMLATCHLKLVCQIRRLSLRRDEWR